MALDLSGLNRIAYKGFETAEEKETRDALLDAGYTIVNPKDNPFLDQTPTKDAQEGPSEREKGKSGILPQEEPKARDSPATGQKTGIAEPPPVSSMRDVWGKAYRLYARCAPALRSADQEAAEDLFLQAAEEVRIMGGMGDDGVIVGAAVLEMLDSVWKRAEKGLNG